MENPDETCVLCKREKAGVKVRAESGPSFRKGMKTPDGIVAKFNGRCVARCGIDIEVGDLIIEVEDEGWAHFDCA